MFHCTSLSPFPKYYESFQKCTDVPIRYMKTSSIRGGIGSSDAQQLVNFFNFPKFFGHQEAKNCPIFLKIKSGLALTPGNNNLKLHFHRLRTFDFIERKPSVTDRRQTPKSIIELLGRS